MNTRTRVVLIGAFAVIVLIVLVAKNRGALDSAPETASTTTGYSVSVVTAAKQPVEHRISVVGTINAFNDIIVLSETQGRVVKVDVEVGQYKEAGSVLVEVDSELKHAAYEAASASYEKAKKDLDRYEALYKEHSIPEAQMDQARWAFQSAEAQYVAARRQLNDTKITTPISGIVTARFVNVGTMVMGAPQATQIANVVDISRLKVKVNVAEKDVFRLQVGEKMEVTTDVFPNTVFAGSIFSISSKGDEGHTYPVEVVLNNPKRQLKAGMFGRVTFTPKSSSDLIVIPRESIVGSVTNAKVYVVNDNVARLRSVVVGEEVGRDIEIVSGLQEGEVVVVNGQNNLSDNVPVVIRSNTR
jgi:RND family efflux transporter MFP subunit